MTALTKRSCNLWITDAQGRWHPNQPPIRCTVDDVIRWTLLQDDVVINCLNYRRELDFAGYHIEYA